MQTLYVNCMRTLCMLLLCILYPCTSVYLINWTVYCIVLVCELHVKPFLTFPQDMVLGQGPY